MEMGRNGDRGGIRTHDNSIKSRVLYQLSYAITSLEAFKEDGTIER